MNRSRRGIALFGHGTHKLVGQAKFGKRHELTLRPPFAHVVRQSRGRRE
ncbi:hypothetical protein RR42_m0590 [Cupriavidus basilensis]|uniref:Uncharacterized protein n=1 Tax=Cupriavidus basilensis TaxID=68895 RepID=A0A0C4Y561_9BURK|nr:hypothetical protein RR42_m0590 [Cupriavidus basilensis]